MTLHLTLILTLTRMLQQEAAHQAPAVLLRMEAEARAGWERMLAAGSGGATLMVAAAGAEQLDEMLSGLQDGQARTPVRPAGSLSNSLQSGNFVCENFKIRE